MSTFSSRVRLAFVLAITILSITLIPVVEALPPSDDPIANTGAAMPQEQGGQVPPGWIIGQRISQTIDSLLCPTMVRRRQPR